MIRNWRDIVKDREFVVFFLTLVPLAYYGIQFYLPFHSFAEGYSIVISTSIFLLNWNSRKIAPNNLFMILGIGLLFSAILDTFHMLNYYGMGVFSFSNEKNYPTQFWIAARFMQVLTFVIAPLFFRRESVVKYFFPFALIYSVISIYTIFTGTYPDCFVPETGLTKFKIYSEISINALVIVSFLLFRKMRNDIDSRSLNCLYYSLIALFISEAAFMTYTDVYDVRNLVGHIFKIISAFFVYRGVLQLSLSEPLAVIFRSAKEEQDRLGVEKNNLQKELLTHISYLNLYKKALDASSIFVVTDKEGVIEYVNDAFLKISQFDRNELIGKTHRVVNSGHHDLPYFENLWQTITAGEIWSGETKNRAKDGTEYWVWGIIVPFKNEHGKIEKFVSVRQDITESKKQREKMIQLEKLSAVGELSAKILHDTMNPLSIIKSSTMLLRRNILNKEYERLDETIDYIDQSADRIQDLFSSLRENLARKNSVNTVDGSVKLSIHKIIDSSILYFKEDPRFSTPVIEIENNTNPDHFVLGKQFQLVQVFLNLLNNSYDEIKGFDDRWIKVRSEVQGLSLVIHFSDCGARVSSEIAKKMFDSFFTTKGEKEGTGLGLAICREILHQMKGHIEINKRSENMEFLIKLPLYIE